ncbi:multiheme c-type cytochrome [Blastopirellula retiformator]|uniref:Cytochrome c-554 n=1 Tax=Blastopirellula retiformator TaxID=2527970 RepID=A0A5C5VKM1_9BACT|nr:multiheme c-type cytochrome [Blastopirellula retiformator]TWT39164.1 Cytochrome c-554 precursor [Blastopirellula retiformator]
MLTIPVRTLPAILALVSLSLPLFIGCEKPQPSQPGEPPKPKGTEEKPPAETSPAETPSAMDKGTTPPPALNPPLNQTPAETKTPAETETTEAADPPPLPARELFAGWEKPRLALFLTGEQHGYIEPCGCTGLTNQKGGLNRRFTFLNQLRKDKGWDVVALDAGNQVRRFGRQAEIKFQTTANAIKQMDYEVITFGPDDLRLSVDEVFVAVADEDPEKTRFMAANASLLGVTPSYRIIEQGGLKIGVTGVFGDRRRDQVSNNEVEFQGAVEGLEAVWPELEAAKCDLYVLLASASLEESREYARKFPGFRLIVTAGGVGEPTLEMEKIEGTDAEMVQVGVKGMFAGVVGLYGDQAQEMKYERVPLDSRFPDSDEMMQLLANYQQQLEALGWDGLGIKPIEHPTGREFVGSNKCGECHSTAFEIWENTPHSHATQTLVHPPERYEVARHFDPECIACHVVGWNQSQYVPYKSGYLSLEETPLMQGVGCENCHGPGATHVAAEEGELMLSDEEITKLRQDMVLPLDAARQTCIKCHDIDNSPDFHVKGAFDEYWEQVEHYGKD